MKSILAVVMGIVGVKGQEEPVAVETEAAPTVDDSTVAPTPVVGCTALNPEAEALLTSF